MTQQLLLVKDQNDSLKNDQHLVQLSDTLLSCMQKIDSIPNYKWHFYRKLFNPFDFRPFKKQYINRAFYKLWELVYTHPLLRDDIKNTCHLAEAPGSFVQVVRKLLPKVNITAVSKPPMTYSEVVKNNTHTPTFSPFLKSTITNCNFIHLDLLSNNNLHEFLQQYTTTPTTDPNAISRQSFDFISADGGLDDYELYSQKEILHYNLIYSQIISILFLLRKHGNCVLKIFDIYTDTTLHIIYLLAKHFKYVVLTKPTTSRPTNSEKYLLCFDFIGTNYDLENCISLLNNITNGCTFNQIIPHSFTRYILDSSKVYIQQQIESINFIINHIHLDDEKNSTLVHETYQTKYKTFCTWKNTFNLDD